MYRSRQRFNTMVNLRKPIVARLPVDVGKPAYCNLNMQFEDARPQALP